MHISYDHFAFKVGLKRRCQIRFLRYVQVRYRMNILFILIIHRWMQGENRPILPAILSKNAVISTYLNTEVKGSTRHVTTDTQFLAA